MGGPGFYDCGGARFFSVGPWSYLIINTLRVPNLWFAMLFTKLCFIYKWRDKVHQASKHSIEFVLSVSLYRRNVWKLMLLTKKLNSLTAVLLVVQHDKQRSFCHSKMSERLRNMFQISRVKRCKRAHWRIVEEGICGILLIHNLDRFKSCQNFINLYASLSWMFQVFKSLLARQKIFGNSNFVECAFSFSFL